MKELLHMYISKTEYKIVGVANHSLFPYKYRYYKLPPSL